MRIMVLASLMLVSSAVDAKAPVALNPFAGGLSFSETPRPLPPDHPLYRRIMLEPIADLPDRIGSMLNPITSGRELSAAVAATLAAGNMSADSPSGAKVRLTVTWLPLDAPLKIGPGAKAIARVRYELRRIDNGQAIFAREIVTRTRSTGGNAADRYKGTARAAILANLASAIVCFDKAAIGIAPADCALEVGGQFSAPIERTTIRYR
jgi:hypothetical protein